VTDRTLPAWRREDGDDVVLALHVQPGAKRSEVAGIHGEGATARLKIRLAAPPVEGKANAELLRFLASAFGVPQRGVLLLRGESSRQKSVQITRPVLRPDRDWILAHGASGK
jgi:uncharacterized protein (TIGR00251 family)